MPWGLAIAACECVQPIFADFFVCALLGTYAFGISFSGLRCVTATGGTGLGARLLLSGQDPTAVRASHDGRTTPGVRRQPKPRQAQRLVGYASGRLWVDLVMDVSHFFLFVSSRPVLVDTVGSMHADHMLGKAVTALKDAGGNGKVSEVFRFVGGGAL